MQCNGKIFFNCLKTLVDHSIVSSFPSNLSVSLFLSNQKQKPWSSPYVSQMIKKFIWLITSYQFICLMGFHEVCLIRSEINSIDYKDKVCHLSLKDLAKFSLRWQERRGDEKRDFDLIYSLHRITLNISWQFRDQCHYFVNIFGGSWMRFACRAPWLVG